MANVLIVDDDPKASDALATLLRRAGHLVSCVSSAASAVTHLRSHGADLVLLDIELSAVNGLELLDALREEPCGDGLRFAIYSGHDEPAARAVADRLGACDYIVKGQPWPTTLERIQTCLMTSPSDGAAASAAAYPPA